MLETVRARLTLWYVSLLAAILLVVLVMTYALLARALYVRIDDTLAVLIQTAAAGCSARRAAKDDIAIPLPPLEDIPSEGAAALISIVETDDLDDRHRLAIRRVTVPPGVE